MQKTSFVRKGTPKTGLGEAAVAAARADAAASTVQSSVPSGSKISPHTGQLIISTGLADFDGADEAHQSILSVVLKRFFLSSRYYWWRPRSWNVDILEEDVYSSFNQIYCATSLQKAWLTFRSSTSALRIVMLLLFWSFYHICQHHKRIYRPHQAQLQKTKYAFPGRPCVQFSCPLIAFMFTGYENCLAVQEVFGWWRWRDGAT